VLYVCAEMRFIEAGEGSSERAEPGRVISAGKTGCRWLAGIY
jgi:hypothetical protein